MIVKLRKKDGTVHRTETDEIMERQAKKREEKYQRRQNKGRSRTPFNSIRIVT